MVLSCMPVQCRGPVAADYLNELAGGTGIL